MQKFKELILMEYVKILLSAYPNLDKVIRTEGENYLRRCFNSAFFLEPCDKFSEKLLSLYARREKIIVLKNKLDVLFSRLSDEEKAMLNFKFAGILPKTKFTFSTRTYFRRQIKLMKKIEEYLGFLNLTEETFKKDYADIWFFKSLGQSVKEIARRRNDLALKKIFSS